MLEMIFSLAVQVEVGVDRTGSNSMKRRVENQVLRPGIASAYMRSFFYN
jgi:hypothetical protein